MAEEKKSKDSKQEKVAVKKATAKIAVIKEEVAFKDFKKAVTVGEFEAILEVVTEEYKKMEGVVKSSLKFDSKIQDSIDQIQSENGDDLPAELTRKLVEGLKIKATNEVVKLFSDQIRRSDEVTDFINKFQLPGEEKPYLDFSFLKQ